MKTFLYELPQMERQTNDRVFEEIKYTENTYESLFRGYLDQTSVSLGESIILDNPNPYCLFVEDGSNPEAPARVVQAILLVSQTDQGAITVYPAYNLITEAFTTTAGGHMHYVDNLYRELEEEIEIKSNGNNNLSVKSIIAKGGKFVPVGIVEEQLATGINYLGLVSFLIIPTNNLQFCTVDKDREIRNLSLEEALKMLGNQPDKTKASYHLFALLDYLNKYVTDF